MDGYDPEEVLNDANIVFSGKIDEKNELIKKLSDTVKAQKILLEKFQNKPLYYAFVLDSNNCPDPDYFTRGKGVRKVGEQCYLRGKIVSDASDGEVSCDFKGQVLNYKIGIDCDPEVKLLEPQEDGTHVVILFDGKPLLLNGVPEMNLTAGDTVLVKCEKDIPPVILRKVNSVVPGQIAEVSEVFDNGTIMVQGNSLEKVVLSNKKVNVGDRVSLDSQNLLVVNVLPKHRKDLYTVSENLEVSWDDIGGLTQAKRELKQIIEMPILKKKVYEYYKKPIPKGVLLYGPPGCGKTMCGKACFTTLAKLHGAEVKESGFIYCKGPEILDKWVGNSERAIRSLFQRGREHFEKYGYPALMFIDEADSIFRRRGSDHSSGILDTIVPQFLSEMDGLDSNHTIVILATNRPEVLDPAIVRDQRISKRIKVSRPDEDAAFDILNIHLKDIPLHETSPAEICATLMSEIYSKTRCLYKVNDSMFCMGDALNGGMLKSFVEEAQMLAIERDTEDSLTGVTLKDFRKAVEIVYQSHLDVSHDYDVQDFAEENGICGELNVVKANTRHGQR